MTRKHYNDGFEGPPLEAGITWWPSEGQSVEAGADEVTKVTPAMQTAWCAFEPAGQFSEGMSFARFNGMLRHAFLSGYAAASVDTRPEGGDALAAPFTSGAIGEAETPENTLSTCNSTTIGERQAIAEALREALKDPAIAIGFQWSSPSEKLLDHSLDFLASHVRDAILSLDSPSLGEGVCYLSDRFEYAAPGDQQEDAWIVRFCDRDCGDQIWTGPDAEAQAWASWERYAPAFNIYVFRLARLKTPTTNAPVAAQREAIARIIDPTAWKLDCDGYFVEQVHSDEALAKADAILSLTKTATNADMRGALEPFALISSEGIVKPESGYVTITTRAEYFHRARTVLQGDKS